MFMIIGIIVNIRSMANVGSMFRTADGAGLNKLYLVGLTPAPLDIFGAPRAQIQKTSLGAEKTVPWEKVRSAPALLLRLKKEGYKIIALEIAKGSVLYDKIKTRHRDKIAIVVGNEVRGLPSSILKLADYIAEIPMRGKKESLNVSVAFGIAAYALNHITHNT